MPSDPKIVHLPVVDKDVLGRIVYVQFYVTQDLSNSNLPTAFKLEIVLRMFSADYGTTGAQTISSGLDITLSPNIAGPSIAGRIDDWRGLLADGSEDTDASWKNSTHVAFLVTALAKPSIPIAHIPLGKVKVDIGHSDMYFPVTRPSAKSS